ncbi:hypothetical protein [Desulfatitalea alkaliphila]|uniref:Uncharacterized protein n=1 Tax=Desulfatitalea alkaliphila TaxID=2929485 RepID=A0AA41R121_9BACT|nr:hypothetical protein [Desulfatitalea alkaliphila]MCJ8500897.1 hypothetical protein [Desulfatitalea alkaliphila]
MLDIAVAYNRYRFLGNEFMTWLWFAMETDPEALRKCDPELIELNVGNRMVLENRSGNGKETLTIKGDAAGLEEAVLALTKGALITEMQLIYKSGTLQWVFVLKGESLGFLGIKLPETAPVTADSDMEGAVLEKIYLYEKPIQLIDQVYAFFLRQRLSDTWLNQTQPAMKRWLNEERERHEIEPTSGR